MSLPPFRHHPARTARINRNRGRLKHPNPQVLTGLLPTPTGNAVGGLSSSGGMTVDSAIQAPGLYRAVGSYSGLLMPADDAQQVSLTLAGGGTSADAMWGPTGGPQWVAHDPSKNAQKLKGVAVYDGASGGGAGRHIRKNGVPSGNRIAEGLMSR